MRQFFDPVVRGRDSEGIAVYYFHRTMEEYLTAFRDNGFVLRTLRDVRVSEESVAELPDPYAGVPYADRYYWFPFFMILDFVKVTP